MDKMKPSTESRAKSITGRLPYFAFITLLVTGAFAVLAPQNFMMDDSFFYFQIANNIAHSLGSTFNGIHETNGYHPLWMICCSAFAFLSGGDKQLLLQIGAFAQLLLTGGILFYGIKIARSIALESYYYFMPILIAFFLTFALIGSEGVINGFFFAQTIFLLLKYRDSERASHWFLIGLSMGLMFLSRLDNGIVVVVLLTMARLYNLKEIGFKSSLKLFASASLGVALLAVPYLAYNYINFGHLVPISGALKSTFPAISPKIFSISKTGAMYASFSVALILWGIAFERDKVRRQLALLIGAGSLSTNLYVFAFTDNVTNWNWYWALNAIALVFLLAFIFQYFFKSERARALRIAAGLAAFTCFSAYAGLFSYTQFINPVTLGYIPTLSEDAGGKRWQVAMGEWINKNLPQGTVIATADWPGMLAYYSNAKIFAIDGLVANFKVQDSIKSLGMRYYLKSIGARYLFGPNTNVSKPFMGFATEKEPGGSMKFQFYSVLHRTGTDIIIIPMEERLVETDEIQPRSTVGSDKYFDSWSLWKLDGASLQYFPITQTTGAGR